jgi:hypothetical protein
MPAAEFVSECATASALEVHYQHCGTDEQPSLDKEGARPGACWLGIT